MKRLAIILTLLSSATSLLGQIETTQYFMNTLPQVVDSNPAFFPRFENAIGLPFSRFSAMYGNNGFTYNDAIKKVDGKSVFDVEQWKAGLPDKTYVTSASQLDLLRLGVRVGNAYLSVHSSARELTQAMFPKDIAILLAGGTSAYVGKTASLAPEFHGMTFWETGVGLSFAPTKKLRAGVKVKKLYGAHALNTDRAEILLSVDENYEVDASADVRVQTSGIQDSSFVFKNYLTNSGWAGDFGVTYKLFPKLTLAASVVDLGYIKYRHNLYDYVIDKETANIHFAGLDLQSLLEGNTDTFERQVDSLKEDFKLHEVAGSPFSMMLPSKFYASASYALMESFTVGALFIAENFNGRTGTGWTASLNKNFGKWLTMSVSYTVSHRSYNNLGAGISVKMGPLQLYAVGDNVLGAPVSMIKTGALNAHINNAQVFNGRAGLNFVWGWRRAEEEEVDNTKSFNSRKSSKTKATNDKDKQPKPSFVKARKKN